jgi:hypothetical protein
MVVILAVKRYLSGKGKPILQWMLVNIYYITDWQDQLKKIFECDHAMIS